MKQFIGWGILFFIVVSLVAVGVDFYLQDGTGVRMTRIQSCQMTYWNITNDMFGEVEYGYTCETDYFNYTIDPNYAWCWDYNESNSTQYMLRFGHSFLRGNIPAKTIWWNETEYIGDDIIEHSEELCTNIGRANVWFNQSNVITHYICDYSSWGECSLDFENKRLTCDSKYDGNGDGVCQGGESCLILDMSGGVGSFQEFKQTYNDLNTEEFGISCTKQ